MTKFLGRASAVVLAALIATTVPQAAMAQKKGEAKAPSYKFSKKVQPLLADAQAKQKAGDNAGAMAALDQADAVPDKNSDDAYMISMLRLNSAISLKDNALIERALEGALATGRVSPEDTVKFQRNLGALALQRNDYAKAMAEFEKVIAASPNDADLMIEMAEMQRRQGQDQKAIATMNQAIAAKAAAGEKADETWYRRALAIAYDKKLAAETVTTSEALLRAYPSATNWRDVLIIFRDSGKFDDQANLDILRLMRANAALTGERDFAEYAETATLRGFPGEAKAVLDEGIAKGALQSGKPLVKELQSLVNPKVAADKASLPGLEKEAAAAKTGRSAAGTADAYLGYGDYAKAATLYKLALSKGGVDTDAVNTRLGFALGKTGDKAGAEAALKAVSAAPRNQLAKYYLVWLGSQS
jgi:tetratricopeptide (TPR) repeat protein